MTQEKLAIIQAIKAGCGYQDGLNKVVGDYFALQPDQVNMEAKAICLAQICEEFKLINFIDFVHSLHKQTLEEWAAQKDWGVGEKSLYVLYWVIRLADIKKFPGYVTHNQNQKAEAAPSLRASDPNI